MKDKITFLLVKLCKKYFVYSPNTYGIESWGGNTQYSIVKKRKYWYFNTWHGFNSDYQDDIDVYTKLNVILETTDKQSIINVCKIICPNQLSEIDTDLQSILDTYFDFLHFYKK